jgi:predicted transcriptional regulator
VTRGALTTAVETLLRHLADEALSASVEDAAAHTGLPASVVAVAMRELYDDGYVQERPRHTGAPAGLPDLFEITPSGRRTASRLD